MLRKVYLGDVTLSSRVEFEEGFLFLTDEYKVVVLIILVIGGEFNVGDDCIIVLVLGGKKGTCSSLVLNQSLALLSLIGIN